MPAKATAAAPRPKQEIMHPFILEQLAAEHVKEHVAGAKPGAAEGERERARQHLQAVGGGCHTPRLEGINGDDVPVERAKVAAAGWLSAPTA